MSNAALLSDYAGSSDVPIQQNYLLVSDINRFVFAFGCNDYGTATVDPMLIRWCDQEDPYNWTPASTNQAGFLRLSRGSQIITANQSRQEVLVWTDAALYSLQYVGPPYVWTSQLMGDNISIMGPNAAVTVNNVTYWMGQSNFFAWDGSSVQPMPCSVWDFLFRNLDRAYTPSFNLLELESLILEQSAIGEVVVRVVGQIETAALVAVLHAIEEQCGRGRADPKWAPRVMDIDLLAYGDTTGRFEGARLPRSSGSK